jgi:putative tricarboxylic transport membrane protein
LICLAAFTPVLAKVALSFGAQECFRLALFGVAMSGTLVGDDPLKGWLMGALGLVVSQVGQEGIYAYDRFTFDIPALSGGIAMIPALIGAFGFAEVQLAGVKKPAKRAEGAR